MRKLIFRIKEGIYCSWCVSMIKKMLGREFAIKNIEVDIIGSKVKMLASSRTKPDEIVDYLHRRGYNLRQEQKGRHA